MLRSLFGASDFVPRRLCGLWTPPLLTLHIASDFTIWLCYVLIGLLLWRGLHLWYKGRIDMAPAAHLAPLVIAVFGAFILLCGGTHLNQVIVFFHPYYRFMGVWTALTAIASFLAVLTLWKTIKLSTIKP